MTQSDEVFCPEATQSEKIFRPGQTQSDETFCRKATHSENIFTAPGKKIFTPHNLHQQQ